MTEPDAQDDRCGNLGWTDRGPLTCQRESGHAGLHRAWSNPIDPNSESREWAPIPEPDADVAAFSVEQTRLFANRYTGDPVRRRIHEALDEIDRLAARLQEAEREREVARIKGLTPEDAQRYFDERNEWVARAEAAEAREAALREALAAIARLDLSGTWEEVARWAEGRARAALASDESGK